MDSNSYASLGVSASKSGLHDVLKSIGGADSSGLFAQVSEDLLGNQDYYSIMHCDGAGTKSIVPYLYCRDTGRTDLFSGLAQDALVMNLDDIYCIGIPEKLLVANAIARNSRLISNEMIGAIISRYKTLATELNELGIPIEVTGGETADCGDLVRTLLVDATIFGRIKKDQIIDTKSIIPGDVIIGLSSTGRTNYESADNSGIGSNGLTLARHSLLSHYYFDNYPESVDPNIESKIAYRGPFYLRDNSKSLGMTIGEALCSPTRTYAPILKKILESLPNSVHGIIHNTGGGQTKVIRFGRRNLYVKDNLFDIPLLFQLVQQHGKIPWREMYQVFNMGHRIEVYVPKECGDEVIKIAKQFDLAAQQIGHVEELNQDESSLNKVIIIAKEGNFEYS